jgi:hypothetical protein
MRGIVTQEDYFFKIVFYAILLFGAATSDAREALSYKPTPSPVARQAIEEDWQLQEKVTRQVAADSPAALDGLLIRGRMMCADLGEQGGCDAVKVAREKLEEIGAARDKLVADKSPAGDAWLKLYLDLRWAIRSLAFSNPRLDFDSLVFVKRRWPSINHQCSHRVGEAQAGGANICILTGLHPDGSVRELLDADHARGGVGRPDLSFDAKQLVFPYAEPRTGGKMSYGYGQPGVRGGKCLMYDIWTVHVDGTDLKNLTRAPGYEDTEPCYLPDGRIAFTSSRSGRLVQCGNWALVCGIYSMKADGSDVRQVTEPKEGEFYPSMLDDGRIIYTRWDYVMKGYNVIQQVWAVSPDGTRSQLYYGDWYAFSKGPIALFEARQVPGSGKLMAVGAAHHNSGVGPLMLVDPAKNRGARDSMINVTPEIAYPETGALGNEVEQPELTYKTLPDTGWYTSPWPLSEKHFLCVYSFDAENTSPFGYGIYLQDIHGNKELIYRGSDFSCYAPMPLKPRPRPKELPDTVKGQDPQAPGTLIVTDIYKGLIGVKRGEVKFLRVLETHPKIVETTPQRVDMGVNCGWDARGVLGTVPVEEDGSACFLAPSNRQLFFEALDKDHLEIRRMRNFMNLMPGETVGCVGCHESYSSAAKPAVTEGLMALKRAPSKITPPAWGTGGLAFPRVVQPVLDRLCVKCHDGEKGKDKSFDLRGLKWVKAPGPHDPDQGPQHLVSDSFLKLLDYVAYVRVGGYHGPKLPLQAFKTGSHESRLMQVLAKRHHGLTLATDDWQALACWIDCNAPFYGDWENIIVGPAKGADVLRELTEVDKALIDTRVRQLNSQIQEKGRLVGYLSGGLQERSDLDKNIVFSQVQGQGWTCPEMQKVENLPPTQRALTFSDVSLKFAVKGLDPAKRYALGLTWWDYNNAQRLQSISGKGIKDTRSFKLLDTTLLPNYLSAKQLPGTVMLAIPAELSRQGELSLTIQKEGGANAVVSEIWLEEHFAETNK